MSPLSDALMIDMRRDGLWRATAQSYHAIKGTVVLNGHNGYQPPAQRLAAWLVGYVPANGPTVRWGQAPRVGICPPLWVGQPPAAPRSFRQLPVQTGSQRLALRVFGLFGAAALSCAFLVPFSLTRTKCSPRQRSSGGSWQRPGIGAPAEEPGCPLGGYTRWRAAWTLARGGR